MYEGEREQMWPKSEDTPSGKHRGSGCGLNMNKHATCDLKKNTTLIINKMEIPVRILF